MKDIVRRHDNLLFLSSLLFDITVDIVNLGIRPKFRLSDSVFVGLDKLRDFAVRVIEVPEYPGPSHAGIDTRRDRIFSDPVNTQAAFVRTLLLRIDKSLLVGAARHAQFAADAYLVADLNSIVLVVMRCSGRTNVYAGSIPAVVAELG
jgi:hypothetical protein